MLWESTLINWSKSSLCKLFLTFIWLKNDLKSEHNLYFWIYFRKLRKNFCHVNWFLNSQKYFYYVYKTDFHQTSHGGWFNWCIGMLEIFNGIRILVCFSPCFWSVCLIICLKNGGNGLLYIFLKTYKWFFSKF